MFMEVQTKYAFKVIVDTMIVNAIPTLFKRLGSLHLVPITDETL